jgi:hypothetical protein
MVVLKQDRFALVSMTQAGWMAQGSLEIGHRAQLARDPRGVLVASAGGNGFTAFLGGSECDGSYGAGTGSDAKPGTGWSVRCHESDDPWPILNEGAADGTSAGSVSVKAFFNAARNYFTGVVTPGIGVDLPPFYSAVLIPRAAGPALLIGGIDGKVQLADSGALRPVSGARDWGSDFAALRSGCGGGSQIIASSSGEAAQDSLRAYELPAQEAVPASAPLAMEGTVTALWTAPGGKSVLAAVKRADGEYEVDRVTAGCN